MLWLDEWTLSRKLNCLPQFLHLFVFLNVFYVRIVLMYFPNSAFSTKECLRNGFISLYIFFMATVSINAILKFLDININCFMFVNV